MEVERFCGEVEVIVAQVSEGGYAGMLACWRGWWRVVVLVKLFAVRLWDG